MTLLKRDVTDDPCELCGLRGRELRHQEDLKKMICEPCYEDYIERGAMWW